MAEVIHKPSVILITDIGDGGIGRKIVNLYLHIVVLMGGEMYVVGEWLCVLTGHIAIVENHPAALLELLGEEEYVDVATASSIRHWIERCKSLPFEQDWMETSIMERGEDFAHHAVKLMVHLGDGGSILHHLHLQDRTWALLFW